MPAYYKDLGAVLNEPKKMDDIEWLLAECRKRNLLTNLTKRSKHLPDFKE
jgi:hypothetical protein